MKYLILYVILSAFCIISFACSSSDTGKKNVNLENTKWLLSELDGVKYSLPPDGKTVFIMFEGVEKKASGMASCNNYFASYNAVKTADGGDNVQLSLKFGPVTTTEMYCNYMDTETKYISALKNTASYKITGGKLYLYDESGKVALRFKAE